MKLSNDTSILRNRYDDETAIRMLKAAGFDAFDYSAYGDKIENGIAFNMAEYYDYIHSGEPFDICYTIEENKHHNATSSLQLFVKEIRVSK